MTLLCNELSVSLGGRDLLARADLAFLPGRVTAILGPNGAGKSTLLTLLGGQPLAHRGQVLLDGVLLAQIPPAQLALRRALMPQESAVAFEFTAQEIVALGRFPHRGAPVRDEDAIVRCAMQSTDVAALAQRVYNTLSGGEKSRVQMARSLSQLWLPHPAGVSRWLLLDEPTAALDLAHQHVAMRLLRERAGQGIGVIAVLHDINLARRYADDVLVLDGDGAAQSGGAAQVLLPPLIERVWRTPCQEVPGPGGTVQFVFG